MRHKPVAFLAAALCGLLLAAATPSARAAPDQTQGMALMSAVVRLDGTLVSGSGVVSSDRFLAFDYRVTFTRSVQGCTFVASSGTTENEGFSGGGVPISTSVTFNGTLLLPNVVSVFTHVDGSPFMLIVFCPK